MTEIPSTPADGKLLALLIPEVADINAITVTEATATGVVDISCYLTSDGFTPGLDEQVIADERMCSRETFEQPGRSSTTLSLTYVDNTNSPDETEFNKAKETLVPYSKHTLLVRRGLDYEEPIAADQTYSAYPIKPGKYSELPPEANSVLKISQKQFIHSASAISKKIVAAAP